VGEEGVEDSAELVRQRFFFFFYRRTCSDSAFLLPMKSSLRSFFLSSTMVCAAAPMPPATLERRVDRQGRVGFVVRAERAQSRNVELWSAKARQ